MNKLFVFVIGFVVLMLVSRIQPMRGWLYHFLAQKQLFWFFLPLLILFGWPIENLESFRTGADLGWQRYARIVLFIGFFVFYVSEIAQKKQFRLPASAPIVIFVIYCSYAALSALYSPEPIQTAWKAFELLVVLLFVLKLHQSCRFPSLNAVAAAGAIAYIAFALCVMSIVGGILAPEDAWRDFGLTGFGFRSMAGVAPSVNPNTLGQLGSIVFLIGFAQLLLRAKRDWFGNGILLVVGLVTLFLAYSRTSIIGTFLVAALLMILLRKYTLLFFTLPVVALLTVLFVDSFIVYLARGQSAEQFASLSGRTFMWEAALESWRSSPWFGHGFFVGHKYVELDYKGFLQTADSTYVETLVNLGLLGFLLISSFALSAVLLAKDVMKLTLRGDNEFFVASSILVCFIAVIFIRSLTASSFQVLHYNLLFFLVSIVCLLCIKSSIRNRPLNL